MGMMIEARVQCDVCGDEVDEKYPPMVNAADLVELDNETFHDLKKSILKAVKDRGWTYAPDSPVFDRWHRRIVLRCKACKEEVRWE